MHWLIKDYLQKNKFWKNHDCSSFKIIAPEEAARIWMKVWNSINVWFLMVSTMFFIYAFIYVNVYLKYASILIIS